MMKPIFKLMMLGLVTMGISYQSEAASLKNSHAAVMATMQVDPTSSTSSEYDYANNTDSVRDNQNTIKLNAASRAVALGQRAVALATESGKDVEDLKKEIENRDDVLMMLKGIAKIQAQDLQKINAITAMRAKIMELNAIDNMIANDIYVTSK